MPVMGWTAERGRRQQAHRDASMNVIETIAPIFIIIMLGYIVKRQGFLPVHFTQEANRLTFLFTLPVLIFTGIVKSDARDVTPSHILTVILPTAIGSNRLAIHAPTGRRGTKATAVATQFRPVAAIAGWESPRRPPPRPAMRPQRPQHNSMCRGQYR